MNPRSAGEERRPGSHGRRVEGHGRHTPPRKADEREETKTGRIGRYKDFDGVLRPERGWGRRKGEGG